MEGSTYIIQVYTAFVTATHLFVKGRVLKDRSPISFENQGMLSSLFNTILRARSKEIPNTGLRCIFGQHSFELTTDHEGYFEILHEIKSLPSIPEEVHITGLVKGKQIQTKHRLRTYLFDVPFGMISDIDDTIMVSRVRSFFKLRLLFNTIFVNPFRRKPIDHAAEAFHAMLTKTDGQAPIIYLSNSPWNIYDYLEAFLVHNSFPVGEIILRDIGTQLLRSRAIEQYNKYIEIEKLLQVFSETKFILIGDTGEKDFNIYLAILEKYPNRIKQILLHNVGNRKKLEEIRVFKEEDPAAKIYIVDDYLKMIDS